MLVSPTPPIGSFVPHAAAILSPTHPLARGAQAIYLENDWGRQKSKNHVRPKDDFPWNASTGTFPQGRLSGAGLVSIDGGSGATNTGQLVSSPSSFLQPASSVSIIWIGYIRGAASNPSQSPPIVSMYFNNANASPFISYGLHRNAAQTTPIFFYVAGGSLNNVTVTGGINSAQYPNAFIHLCGTRKSGQTILYVNGRNRASDSVSGALTYGGTCNFRTNTHVTVNNSESNVVTLMAGVWNRVLSPQEVWSSYESPYAMFSYPGLEFHPDFTGGPALPGAGPRAFVVC